MASTKKFKWLKRIGIFLGILIAALFVLYLLNNESLPEGKTGPEADALAQKVLTAINKTAWDTTGAVSWNFAGRHEHLWDRDRHFAEVKWEDYRVLVNINEIKVSLFPRILYQQRVLWFLLLRPWREKLTKFEKFCD